MERGFLIETSSNLVIHRWPRGKSENSPNLNEGIAKLCAETLHVPSADVTLAHQDLSAESHVVLLDFLSHDMAEVAKVIWQRKESFGR
jgi:hypothetical protein